MTPTPEQRRERLRHEIMLAMRANGTPVTGLMWLGLIFMSEAGLRGVARELCIRVDS